MTKSDNLQLPLFETDPKDDFAAKQIPEAGKDDALKEQEVAVESPFSKYIVYVDESGDHSLQSIDEPVHDLLYLFIYIYYC